MASAAAVAVDQALSPERLNLAEPDQIGGTVTSAIIPPDEETPNELSELQRDDDEDEDVVIRSRPRGPQMNGPVENEEEEELGEDDDLFGDDADEGEAEVPQRTLDDEDLDSGDDEDRQDRLADEEDAQEPEQEKEMAVMEAGLGRQPLPEPTDGEMYLTKVPRFLSIDPKAWHHTTYQPPTTDHHADATPDTETTASGFSAYNTALSTIHWRKSPSNPKETQSNARILRWSDGTLTLQFASNPTQQFVIEGNPLAPRQSNPVKPTPTSRKHGAKEHGHDSFTYLTMPDPHNQLLRITHKLTAGLSILPSAETTDEALITLQNSLAAIAQGKSKGLAGLELIPIDEDPELAKKKAEVAEREKMRAAKRRDAAETRERERSNRTFGGRSARHGGGLSASMLEDDEMGLADRGRTKGKRQPQKERRRRNSEYSDDEDFGRKRGNFANDEYDEEDEFIARSDEEDEAIASSDEDDGIVEDAAPKRQSVASAKRASPEAMDDEDAEGEEEEEVVQTSRVKRRRVVDDDDEEE